MLIRIGRTPFSDYFRVVGPTLWVPVSLPVVITSALDALLCLAVSFLTLLAVVSKPALTSPVFVKLGQGFLYLAFTAGLQSKEPPS